MDTWVITHDGKAAWEWSNPSNRIDFAEAHIYVDAWKERMERDGFKIVDDRFLPCGNVWD